MIKYIVVITKIFFLMALASPLLAFARDDEPDSRDRIRIVGSSSLYPYVAVVAERFGKISNFKTPIVESTGTGGGINLLCSGNDLKYPDIATSSRKIKPSEIKRCHENGVANIKEILIGKDAIVIASKKNSPDYNFSIRDIFLAIASFVPHEGKLVPNFYSRWKQINPDFSDHKIVVYGPSFTTGTRETLVELALVKYCIHLPEFIKFYPNLTERTSACKLVRRDGIFIDMGKNDNVIIQKIKSNPISIGIIGYNFFIENKYKIKQAKISGIEANYETITSKTYPFTRELYLYVNLTHEKMVVGVKEFLAEFDSDQAVGKYGYLTQKNFIAARE